MKNYFLILGLIFFYACSSPTKSQTENQLPDIFQASPIDYNKTAYELRHSELWLDYYKIPRSNGLPLIGSIEGDDYFPFWYDAAVSIADFNGDGFEDILHSKTGSDLVTAEYPLELFLNDQTNQNFILNNTLIPDNAKNTTARESAIGDFNNDGKPDVFYSPHGIHGGPGETPSMLISNETGYSFKRFDELQPDFYHNLTSGDINNDGLLDVILFGGGGGYNGIFTFLNTGNGEFNIVQDYIINDTSNMISNIWSHFLYDLNKDNILDLVIAGGFNMPPFGNDQNDGINTLVAILYGDGNSFRLSNSTIVIQGQMYNDFCGDVVITDIEGDGIDEVIARCAKEDGESTEYLRLFSHDGNFNFTEKTAELIENNENTTGRSMVWLRAQDIDGDGNVDIFNSDKGNSNIGNVQHWEWDGSKMRRK